MFVCGGIIGRHTGDGQASVGLADMGLERLPTADVLGLQVGSEFNL